MKCLHWYLFETNARLLFVYLEGDQPVLFYSPHPILTIFKKKKKNQSKRFYELFELSCIHQMIKQFSCLARVVVGHHRMKKKKTPVKTASIFSPKHCIYLLLLQPHILHPTVDQQSKALPTPGLHLTCFTGFVSR